jgi:hypothetical protein
VAASVCSGENVPADVSNVRYLRSGAVMGFESSTQATMSWLPFATMSGSCCEETVVELAYAMGEA